MPWDAGKLLRFIVLWWGFLWRGLFCGGGYLWEDLFYCFVVGFVLLFCGRICFCFVVGFVFVLWWGLFLFCGGVCCGRICFVVGFVL